MLGMNLRHHSSDNNLEKESTGRHESREITSDVPAHGHEPGEKGQDAEEQGDDLKWEQEPGHEEVVLVVAVIVRIFILYIKEEEKTHLTNW